MKNLKIKKINKSGLNTFVKLWNQDYLLLTSSGFRLSFQKAYTGFKNKMFDYYGLYLNNNLIGFTLIKKDNQDNFFWLKHMLIDKNYRSLGFGKYFLSWVIKKI
ncbi:MAG: GNAT family N-acetyltransferase [Microgenomates group bacterium]